MLCSYKGRVEYKNPNEMCSFINEYISNCIFRKAEHLDVYFCVMNDCVNIYRTSVKKALIRKLHQRTILAAKNSAHPSTKVTTYKTVLDFLHQPQKYLLLTFKNRVS
jgi:hemerythrin-like domain-containing protein